MNKFLNNIDNITTNKELLNSFTVFIKKTRLKNLITWRKIFEKINDKIKEIYPNKKTRQVQLSKYKRLLDGDLNLLFYNVCYPNVDDLNQNYKNKITRCIKSPEVIINYTDILTIKDSNDAIKLMLNSGLRINEIFTCKYKIIDEYHIEFDNLSKGTKPVIRKLNFNTSAEFIDIILIYQTPNINIRGIMEKVNRDLKPYNLTSHKLRYIAGRLNYYNTLTDDEKEKYNGEVSASEILYLNKYYNHSNINNSFVYACIKINFN